MTDTDLESSAVEVALDAVRTGIDAAHPEKVLQAKLDITGGRLRVGGERYDLSAYEELLVLGGGNAAGTVAGHLAERLNPHLSGGMVVTDDPRPAGPIDVVTGTHPLPSESNVDATRRLLSRAASADADTLAIVALTGGGSALLSAPVEDVSLSDLQGLTEELLRSGAPIDRINTVRKHVSESKGGRLARELAPATTVGVVFSDVASDDPSVVASGPLSPDPTTYQDALSVLSEYGIDAPEPVVSHLRSGAAGRRVGTPGSDDPAFEAMSTHVVCDNRTALLSAVEVCREAGFETVILSSSIRGEAQEAAKTHAAIAEESRRTGNPAEPPVTFLSGGETTVTIQGGGRGGPNQEFALGAAIEFASGDAGAVALCAADTDGIDGPTDAAGAVVTAETVGDVQEARARLADNDAYGYLDECDALLRTGATGTNVNDLRVLVLPE